ncbi:MAG: IS21-like element helper ATPase IstB [Tannerellaceae bacterium]|nr:IS21-like element helper ATPase IstB [Tannerellaceae bacterium]
MNINIKQLTGTRMEMNKETLERMATLRLQGMYYAFRISLETRQKETMTIDQFVSWLIISEYDDRRNRSIQRAIKYANFRHKASIEDLNFSVERGLDKNQVQRLAELSFITEHKDLFITGSTGTGKTYLATALGYEACQKGWRVFYTNTARLMGLLKSAKAKGTILTDLKKIERMGLLILDDFGMQPFDAIARMNLLDVIEDRYGKKSTIITSQIPVNEWHDWVGDKTVADAVLDRIVHRSLRVELYGESLRK